MSRPRRVTQLRRLRPNVPMRPPGSQGVADVFQNKNKTENINQNLYTASVFFCPGRYTTLRGNYLTTIISHHTIIIALHIMIINRLIHAVYKTKLQKIPQARWNNRKLSKEKPAQPQAWPLAAVAAISAKYGNCSACKALQFAPCRRWHTVLYSAQQARFATVKVLLLWYSECKQ